MKRLNYLLIMGNPLDPFNYVDNKFNLGIAYISAMMKKK